MPIVSSNDKLAQLKKLCEEHASLTKMIAKLSGESTGTSGGGSAPSGSTASNHTHAPAHTVSTLGFKRFKRPEAKKVNLQVLCGLSNSRWTIYRNELRDIATKHNVDTRLSINNQLTKQCITDTVNAMIESRPEMKNLSDPDWFIRQTLQTMLKSSSETHRNLAADKPRRVKKELKDKEVELGGLNSENPSQVQHGDVEMEELGGTDNQVVPESPTGITPGAINSADREQLQPQQLITRPTAESLHVIRDPDWTLSTPNSPSGLQQDESTPKPIKFLGAWSQEIGDDSMLVDSLPTPIAKPQRPRPAIKKPLIVDNLPTPIVKPQHPRPVMRKPLIANYDSDSDDAADSELIPKLPTGAQLTNGQTTGERSNPILGGEQLSKSAPIVNKNKPITLGKSVLNDLNSACIQKTNKHVSQLEKATRFATEPYVGSMDANITSSGPAPDTESTLVSHKRKGRDEDTIPKPEAPASKKGKKGIATIPKTPSRTLLEKNFATPLPASPILHTARCTRAKALIGQGTSSASALPPSTTIAPAADLAKSELRRAAALKGAATRAANKKAKEEALAAQAKSRK